MFHDLLGLFSDFTPKHARKYANLADTIRSAVSEYVSDVGEENFPTDEQSFFMKPEAIDELTGRHAEPA